MNKKMLNIVFLIIIGFVVCSCALSNDTDLEREEQIVGDKGQAVSKDKLRIYSLKENGVRQVVSLFQEKCPDVELSFEVGCTDENGVTLSDAIRILNTELMSGKGPDILILDGLAADDFIEKGILEDVTDIVETRKEKLFYNIITSYNNTENIYKVPMSFKVPVILGDIEIVAAKNHSELMEVFEKKADIGIPFITMENFSGFVGNWFITSDILQETLDEIKLTDFYNYLKTIAEQNFSAEECQTVEDYERMAYWAEQYPEISFAPELDLYFDKAQIGIDMLSECETYMRILTICKEKGLSYQYLNRENGNCFIAENVIGINSSGKHLDVAKQFLEYYLSGEPQSTGIYSSFSINRNSMKEAVYVSENGDWYSSISRKDAPDEKMNIYEPTFAELQELIAFFEELNLPVKDDAVILQKVMEQADACLFEGKNPESAAKDVCSEANLYLSE